MSTGYINGLKKRGKEGYYHYRFKVKGKPFTGNTWVTEKKEAMKILRQEKLKVMRSGKADLTEYTLDVAIEKYKDKHLKKLDTGKEIHNKLKVIARFLGGANKLDEITTEKVGDLREYLEEKRKLDNATINRYQGALKALLNFAMDNWNAVKKLPKFKTLEENGERERILTYEEERDFVEFMQTCVEDNLEREKRATENALRVSQGLPKLPFKKGRVKFEKNARTYLNLFYIYLDTGMRLRELLKFDTRLWLDRRRNVIIVPRDRAKTEKKREIPLTERALQALEDEMAHTGDLILFDITHTAVSRRFKRLFESQDIYEVTPHNLRHTYGTRLVEAGVDIRVIQKLLGHSNIQTTMRYAKVTQEAAQNAVKNGYLYVTQKHRKMDLEVTGRSENILKFQETSNA